MAFAQHCIAFGFAQHCIAPQLTRSIALQHCIAALHCTAHAHHCIAALHYSIALHVSSQHCIAPQPTALHCPSHHSHPCTAMQRTSAHGSMAGANKHMRDAGKWHGCRSRTSATSATASEPGPQPLSHRQPRFSSSRSAGGRCGESGESRKGSGGGGRGVGSSHNSISNSNSNSSSLSSKSAMRVAWPRSSVGRVDGTSL